MKRRRVLGMFAAAALTSQPVFLFAQMARDRPVRIGLLPDLWEEWRALLHAAMRRRGWREGDDYVLVVSGTAPGPDFERTARLVLGKSPDLLYVANTGYAVAAHRLAPKVPIVMVTSGYPVEAGLAQSLARPGGSVTGNSAYAGVGIFGVISFAVSQRAPEMGIRMALGARRTQIFAMVVGRGTALAAAGAAIGIVVALALSKVLSGMLFGVSVSDPLTLGATAVVALATAAVACTVPALRATRGDPSAPLRAG